MFSKASLFLKELAGWKSFIPALLLYLFFGAYIMPNGAKKFAELSEKEVEILDLQFSYPPEKAKKILGEYTNASRSFAVKFGLIADSFYPVSYTLLLIIITAWLFKYPDSNGTLLQHIHMFPLAVLFTDYLENVFIAMLHLKYPYISDLHIYASSALTSFKWLLVIICLLIIAAGVVRKLSVKKVD